METGENMQIDELCLDQLPTEILMKVMDYLELPNKLNLSLVSRRFLDIFSDFHYAKNIQWRIDGYIHPGIAPFNTHTAINPQRFLNIEIGFVEAVDEETYLQFFTKIGRCTTSLKFKFKEPKSLFSCFPVLEALKMHDIKDLTHYNEIPINLKSINLAKVDALVGQEVLEKLEQMNNLITLTANQACISKTIQKKTNNSKLLYRLSNDLNSLLCDLYYASISHSSSLMYTVIEPLHINQLQIQVSYDFNGLDMITIFKSFKNLEHFTWDRDGDVNPFCFQLHNIEWKKLKSLELVFFDYDECQFLCEKCLNTIKYNFPLLNKLILKRVMTHQQLDEVAQRHPSITEFLVDLTEDPRGNKFSVLKHFHQLKKLTVHAVTDFSIIAFDNCPLLPDLEELDVETLDLIPKKTDLDCCCDESEVNPDPDCPYCLYDPENHIPNHLNESVFYMLALKCPKLKKFECIIDDVFFVDLLAVLTYWPELQDLIFFTYNFSRSLDFFDFTDILQELKKLEWNFPPLKKFNCFIAYEDEPKIDKDEGFKLFEIFPTLKSIYLKETMTVADFEKKKYHSK